MEVFKGTVRLAGDADALSAVMLVAENRLKVTSQLHEIGDWDLTEISSRVRADGCHITAEGEELIVSVAEPFRFAEAIGPRLSNPGDGSLLRSREQPQPEEPAPRTGRLGIALGAVPLRWRVVAAGIALIVGLGLFAPTALIGLVLLGALSALLIGAFAFMDPYTAVQLPDPFTPLLLIRTGVGGLAAALIIAVVL